jgi:hypothetical protein
MDPRFSPQDDPQLKVWLQELPAATPGDDLSDQIMDQVYEVARVDRQARRPRQMARRAGWISALLASSLLLFLLPGLQPDLQVLAETPSGWLLRSGAIVAVVGVLLWQLDGLLMLRQSRRS